MGCFSFLSLLGAAAAPEALSLQLSQISSFSDSCKNCLLCGSDDSARSSLALFYAFSLAQFNQEVVFICNKTDLENQLLLLPYGLECSHPTLQNIRFKYFNSLKDLQYYASGLHLLDSPPSAIIVDNMPALFSKVPSKDADDQLKPQLAKTLAILVNALECLRQEHNRPFPLLLSDNSLTKDSSDSPACPLFIYQRFFQLRLDCRGTGDGLFSLSARGMSGDLNAAPYSTEVHYQVKPNYLQLDYVQSL